jgi:nucleoside-diphosphate-sugar epimerase
MNPLGQDLDHILTETTALWAELRGQRIFITGGTGFFGCWLLESFAWANDKFDLKAQAVVLSRDPRRFARKAPHLANHPAISLYPGDVSSFEYPIGTFAHVIHAAVDYSAPLELFLNGIEGTRRTLEFALESRAQRYLLASSGAIYGRQPTEIPQLEEEHAGGPDPTQLRSAYGEGKRVSEFLCTAYHEKHGLQATIARGFAFVGPYLPLDQGSAIGNFIGDAISGNPIKVNGDGTPLRSYLYGADLAIWLWTILLRGVPTRPYNVGAEPAYSIAEIAQIVTEEVNPKVEVQIARKADRTKPAERYVPSTKRAQSELNLKEWIDVREGVRRTAAWHARKAV